MSFVTRKLLLTLSVLSCVGLVAAAVFVWSGVYNVGADDSHTKPVHAVLQALRRRSIAIRADKLQIPPNLSDPARVRQGAGNYDAMCTGCHLGPGMEQTELSMGLYPSPPDLAKTQVGVAQSFWIIKHGIKASGMPAWGKNMDDQYIWNMAAFLQELPKLNTVQYQSLVASSAGHSHGGGESAGHPHAEAMADRHDGAHEGLGHDHHQGDEAVEEESGAAHIHPDGTRHMHAAKPGVAQPGATGEAPANGASTSQVKHAADALREQDHEH